MTPTVSPSPSPDTSRPRTPNQAGRLSARAEHARCGTRHDLLGRYADSVGRAREVVALPGALGSLLVIDRDASTLGDCRLVAHLASDEPAENAALLCSSYLEDSRGRWSRRVTPEDLETVPFAEEQLLDVPAGASPSEVELIDSHGRGHRLEILAGERCSRQVRWCRHLPDSERAGLEMVSVRDVIAYMESYEPVRSLTVEAIASYRGNRRVSVTRLELELERVDSSPLVLNRGLRETALAVLERQGLSMSEIAMRCGRVKHDSRGCASGETNWLARRLGILPSASESAPTPWVHSDVLALIAREGLRVSPREVELG
jgi:hypothetical protein